MAGMLFAYLIIAIVLCILATSVATDATGEETHTTSRLFTLSLCVVSAAFIFSLPGFIAAIGFLIMALSGFLKLIKIAINGFESKPPHKENFEKALATWRPIHQRGRAFDTIDICGIKAWGFVVEEALLTEGASIQERLIPFGNNEFNWKNAPDEFSHKSIQKDDIVFQFGGLFAKPDAVFEAENGHRLVVEIKSKCLELGLKYETEFGLYQLGRGNYSDEPTPSEVARRKLSSRTKDLLQVAIAGFVFSQDQQIPISQITPILRYGDAVIILDIPDDIYRKIDFYSIVFTAFMRHSSRDYSKTIGATELAALIAVMEDDFGSYDSDMKKYSSVKGELVHLFAIHGKNKEAIVEALGQHVRNTDKHSEPVQASSTQTSNVEAGSASFNTNRKAKRGKKFQLPNSATEVNSIVDDSEDQPRLSYAAPSQLSSKNVEQHRNAERALWEE